MNILLVNVIVDLEVGLNVQEYLVWNFNFGMVVIDVMLLNVLLYGDVFIVLCNVYGGVFQLLYDYFVCENCMVIILVWFDGYFESEFEVYFESVKI